MGFSNKNTAMYSAKDIFLYKVHKGSSKRDEIKGFNALKLSVCYLNESAVIHIFTQPTPTFIVRLTHGRLNKHWHSVVKTSSELRNQTELVRKEVENKKELRWDHKGRDPHITQLGLRTTPKDDWDWNTDRRSGSWSEESAVLRLTAVKVPTWYPILYKLFSLVTNDLLGSFTTLRATIGDKNCLEELSLVDTQRKNRFVNGNDKKWTFAVRALLIMSCNPQQRECKHVNTDRLEHFIIFDFPNIHTVLLMAKFLLEKGI